jgi:acyl-CoA synthetase (AMP-forming)/AMP-acid ligase II
MTEWPVYQSIADVPRHWARLRPNAVALKRRDSTMTYAELDRRSNRLANRFLAMAEPGGSAPVAYLGGNSPFVFEAWFAAAKASRVFAALNWRCPVAELAEVVANAQPFVLFVDRAFLASAQAILDGAASPFEIVAFDPDEYLATIDAWTSRCGDSDPGGPSDPSTPCLLGYTSGTTGLPKGVAMSHTAFVNGFAAGKVEPKMAWSADDIVIMAMPNFHLGGSFLTMQALMTGAALTVLPTFEIGELLKVVETDRATILPIVPTALQMLIEDPRLAGANVSSLRQVVYFGSTISAETVRRAQSKFVAELLQYYGTTETWIVTFLDNAGHDPSNPARLTSCGKPVPGVEVRLVDGSGVDVEDGAIGEIVVRSPSMFNEYWRNEKATANAFRSGWYLTGDLARRDADGFYYIVDRAKDMIVSGGENVYSAEVERAILRCPGVAMAAVVGVPDPRWGECVTAVIVPETGAELGVDEVKAHCRTLLAGYKVPKRVDFDSALPLTPSGKVHKPTLRARMAALSDDTKDS